MIIPDGDRTHLAPDVAPATAAPVDATASAKIALRMLQLGALAVVLAAVTYREFELDRFFVPKELVLHVTALVAAAALVRRVRDMRFGIVDGLLAAFLALSAVSAALAANGWLAFRALAVSASGIALFWAAAAVTRAGRQRPLLVALACAVVAGTSTALLQAYGVGWDLFSINRAPGGTLGNRNFIAHLAAFGLPIVLIVALRARHWYGYLFAMAGVAPVVASLVLTRSRAGWLAFAASLVVLALALLAGRATRGDGRTWLRVAGVLLLCAAGAAAAITLPNTLQWRSDNPYLESLRGVAEYQEGSGAGRLIQYRQSLRMAAGSPLLGVGPGNWPVAYPAHAAPGDPSLSGGTPGTTSNPWPSSDWVAFASERGFAAALLLALALIGIAAAAIRRLRTTTQRDDALTAAGTLAVIAATIVAGMFDAVLLLALPAFIVWSALGALGAADRDAGATPVPLRAVAIVAVLVIAAAGTARSTAQLAAMHIFTQRSDATWLARAAVIDPGNYRLRLRLARAGSGLGRDERCRHARAAHALLPSAHEARNLNRNCN
jgi:O-antigen ligase